MEEESKRHKSWRIGFTAFPCGQKKFEHKSRDKKKLL